MPEQQYAIFGINPVPWMASQSARRKGGGIQHYKAEELVVYQAAIKESLQGAPRCDHERLSLKFYFWRNAGTKHDHRADVTNLQKALEDALQGVLFENDRNVIHTESWIVKQDAEAAPMIIIIADEAPDKTSITLDIDAWTSPVALGSEPAVEDFNPEEMF